MDAKSESSASSASFNYGKRLHFAESVQYYSDSGSDNSDEALVRQIKEIMDKPKGNFK